MYILIYIYVYIYIYKVQVRTSFSPLQTLKLSLRKEGNLTARPPGQDMGELGGQAQT